ncbi:MAG: DMT family transporter [Deltaproteobacteria bacterium]|nr:DMT family transporter [Deltaproteobacteria bacterium]
MAVPRRVYVFLVAGLIAASQSANIIRIGDAHPVSIAAWRLIIATVLLAPLAGRNLKLLATLTRREVGLLLLAGVALAAHFFAWIGAVQLTTVANAAIFFSINPVITATAGYLFFSERVTKKLAMSIALGVAGVTVMGWSDLTFSPEQLVGDGAAVLCSIIFSVYFLLGKKLRQKLPTAVYVTAVYGVAALFGIVTMLLLDLPLVDYTPRTWVCFTLMAIVPTMVGHTSFNNALQYIDAGRISTATLSEPLLAGLVAYFVWDEMISIGAGVGYVLISGSVCVLVFDRKRSG